LIAPIIAPVNENVVGRLAAFCAAAAVYKERPSEERCWPAPIIDEAFGPSNMPKTPVVVEDGGIVRDSGWTAEAGIIETPRCGCEAFDQGFRRHRPTSGPTKGDTLSAPQCV